ncbi:hypothetical protein MHU86_20776 [Fragilaria crotonensis]|nr:hypothetical protein MHU86_20776 [Fragilaria crotonensis]
MFLSSFATCYPMITKPSDVQLTFDNVTEDTLAINHVICNPLILQELISMNRRQQPLSENYPPTNVVIFQGSHSKLPPTALAPQLKLLSQPPTTGCFPINLDHSGDPIIVNNISGEAYNRSTVQRLFRTQTAKPIHLIKLMTRIGTTPHCRFTSPPDADLYHVACDPKRIPFSLAVRLIPVYTTGPSGQTIYQAWALPHLNNALHDPELQLFNNFSYYHTAKENHPEFPFIDLMGSDSPVPNYGESSSHVYIILVVMLVTYLFLSVTV